MQATGILCSTVTPFGADGRIDADAFRAHLRMLVAAGCGGLVVNAMTGEGGAMTVAERAQCVTLAAEAAAGAVPVIASIGLGSIDESVDEAADVQRQGASGILLVVGGHRKADFVAAIRRSSPLPLILYNKQSPTPLEVDEIAAIVARVAGISGLAEGNQTQLRALATRLAGRAAVYCTRDSYILESASGGAAGAVSFTANVAPHAAVRLWRMATGAGNATAIGELQAHTTELVTALLERGLSPSIKCLMRALNVHAGGVRQPLVDLTPAEAGHLLSRFSQLTTLFP